MAARAVIDPTERSIEPEMMTKVRPTATTNNTTVCCRTMKKLFSVKNRGDERANGATSAANRKIGNSRQSRNTGDPALPLSRLRAPSALRRWRFLSASSIVPESSHRHVISTGYFGALL